MNIEPWVRFGMRISPKISENPADSRNNRPPNVTLLTVSSSQNVITAALPFYTRSALGQRRIIARIDWMREILLFRPVPELTDVLIRLDGLVPEFQPIFGAFGPNPPDVESTDDVAEVIKFERTARSIGQVDRFQRGHELVLVARVAAGGFQRRIDNLTIDVEETRVLAGDRVKILQHAIDEAVIGIDFKIQRIGNAAHEPDGFFAITFKKSIVAAGLSGDHWIFESGIG